MSKKEADWTDRRSKAAAKKVHRRAGPHERLVGIRAEGVDRTNVRARTTGPDAVSAGHKNIIQEDANIKRAQLERSYGSQLFRDRLESQGVGLKPGEREEAARRVRGTPIYISNKGRLAEDPSATATSFFREEPFRTRSGGIGIGNQYIQTRRTLPASNIPAWAARNTIPHELEHVSSHSFTPSLAERQSKRLMELGATRQAESSVQNEAPDLEHMRINILEMRDAYGVEMITPDMVEDLFWHTQNSRDTYNRPSFLDALEHMIKRQPDLSFEELADLMNTIATRQQSTDTVIV